jgi:hypothetical protein
MPYFRVYIDEVGNNDLKSSNDINHRYLSLTGVIFELGYVAEFLTPQIESLKTEYFGSHPDEPIIFHRKELINQKYPFDSLKDEELRKKFNKDFLDLINKLDFKIITVIIDKLEHTKKYETWKHDPYHYCMEIIVERFFFFLKDNASQGDVMIESRGGKEDIRLKKSFKRILNEGTNYIKPELLNEQLSSKELKVKPKALNVTGLQIADLMAYPSRQYIFDNHNIHHKSKETFNNEIINIISKKYYSKNDIIEGYGIKLLP